MSIACEPEHKLILIISLNYGTKKGKTNEVNQNI